VPTETAIKVVDASALGALVFGEPQAETIATRPEGAPLAAPSLLDFELASVCLGKIRRHPGERERLLAAFRLAGELVLERVAVDHLGALEIAEATGLTAYDASYLWLARALGGELVTLHRKLAAAAAR
jgi:predicted nucleic acid-binding protein